MYTEDEQRKAGNRRPGYVEMALCTLCEVDYGPWPASPPYYPILARMFNSVNAAILTSYFLTQKSSHDADQWIQATQQDIQNATGLTPYKQRIARERLKEFGVLEEKRCGIPAHMCFRLNVERLAALLIDFQQAHRV